VARLLREGMARRWGRRSAWSGHRRGRSARPGCEVAAFSQSDRVAEQPEVHLRPHVEAWCRRDQRLALVGENTNDGHAHVLDLEWRGANRGVGEARAAVFSLIGSFAESATERLRVLRVRGTGHLSSRVPAAPSL